MPESFYIVLPLPAKVLSPNFTIASLGGRIIKAAAAKKYRRLAAEAVNNECVDSIPWNMVSVKASFYFKTNRRHDEDNAVASLKAAYDGLVDAGVVPDDDHLHMSREKPDFFVDKENPRVILYLERIK